MAKKEELFGLMPGVAEMVPSSPSTGLPLSEGRQLTPAQQRMVTEFETQMLVIQGQKAKTVFAIGELAEMHGISSVTFECATATVSAIKQLAQGKGHQPYVDEFSDRQTKMLGRHLLGLQDVGATLVAEIVHRSLYPEPEPPKRRGWFG